MKSLLIMMITAFLFTSAHAQQKKSPKKPKPPVFMEVPPPPKPLPSPEEERELAANPLEEDYLCYSASDTLTDSLAGLIVRNYIFTPGYGQTARLSIEDHFYGLRANKADLQAQAEHIALADSIVTTYQDGDYVFDSETPKKSRKIVFTTAKGDEETFLLVWETDGEGKPGLQALQNEKTHAFLRKGECPAIPPSI